MYAETGLLFPCFQNFSPEIHPFEDPYKNHKPNASLDYLVQASTISEYDFGAEGDLFKAPDAIVEEEPVLGTDVMASAFSMISCGAQELSAHHDIESFQGNPILSEVFYECQKDLLAKAAVEDAPVDELMDIKNIPLVPIEEDGSDKGSGSLSFQKSVSSGCLISTDWMKGTAVSKPRFLDFVEVDFGAVYGMRRAFSEGDIKTLGTSNCSSKERKEKLLRYRNKKSRRNFGRKIKVV
ncbi:uncharacterized protein LOC116203513 isoform X2 [Punica granatum]|uniref:Uncharacterized protein LOC116203513 isoform X2 n=1 Tax=Punica granatum TaxID=22663 RepID=A0A6P8DI22_PUNGR|nr:uncharacterized protein LOC116203513 isoform X2 [Punica granatum]